MTLLNVTQAGAGDVQLRDLVLLSHANPEDNYFTQWLAVQLTNHGYRVWCDLLDLLGGEDFWKEAELTIRRRAAKVLFVLSKASNVKDGPLQELHIAKQVARESRLTDFVIPLHIDELPHHETNIELTRINAVSFDGGWAEGLRNLLAKLVKDEVPTFSSQIGPGGGRGDVEAAVQRHPWPPEVK